MGAKALFDINNIINIYAFARSDPRSDAAEAWLAGGGRISVQILNAFVAVALRKLAMPWEEVLESRCDPVALSAARPAGGRDARGRAESRKAARLPHLRFPDRRGGQESRP